MAPLAFLIITAALPACAHDLYPIRPVRARLALEPGRVVVDLEADSVFWIEEVARLHPMPAADWPEDARARVETYALAHFSVRAGDAPLPGRLAAARYRQLPWEVNEDGRFFLRLVFDEPHAGAPLSARADFYAAYRRELERELKGAPIPYADQYRTELVLAGSGRRLVLTPDAPQAAFDAADARPGAAARAAAAAGAGLSASLGTASAFPLLLAAGLSLAGAEFRPGRAAALAAACLAGGLASAALPQRSEAPWVAAVVASLAAGWGGDLARAAAAAAALAAAGLTWGWVSAARLPGVVPGAAARAAAALGLTAGGTVLLATAWALAERDRRAQSAVSESMACLLFTRRRRLAATVLLLASSIGLKGVLAG